MQAPISPFSVLPTESAAISVRPNIASQKYSVGPKASATLASGGARSRRLIAPTMPPTTEAMVASEMASPPSPRLAIGNPSNVVAMADGVPGVLTRMAA